MIGRAPHLPGAPPWSAASTPIWALVSGYERSLRVIKPLAFLQAFSDDSAGETGDRRLFIAGYLNWAERWAEFADAWAEELRRPPAIEYLRMVEAQNRRDQFAGWDDDSVDRKLEALACVIERFRPLSFQFSVSRRDFDLHVKQNSPRPLTKPHFDCIFGVISMLANWSDQSGFRVPIDFIFDEQDGVSTDVSLLFEQMIRPLPPTVQTLINGHPIFRDDKGLSPLQAADMLAWHLRREHEMSETIPRLTVLRKSAGHLTGELPLELLIKWGNQIQQVPGVPVAQSKSQWRKVRDVMFMAKEAGFVPPPKEPNESIADWTRRCFAKLIGRS